MAATCSGRPCCIARTQVLPVMGKNSVFLRNFSNHSQPKPPPCCCHCCSYYVVASCLQALPLCTAATGALCLHTSWPSCWVALQLPWSPGRCTGLDCSLAGAQGSSGSSRGMLQQATRCSAAGRPCGCPQQPRCARAGHTPWPASALHHVGFNPSAHCLQHINRSTLVPYPPSPHPFVVCAGGGTWRMTRPGVATSASRALCTARSRRKGWCGRC